MNNSFLLLTLILTFGGFLNIENASASNFQIQNIRVGGSGCPSELTQIVSSPDLTSASILFQSFESHVPSIVINGKGSANFSTLNCNVFFDIQLPIGEKLNSLEISYDMRGHTFLEKGVSGNFKSYIMSSMGLGTEQTQRTKGPQILQEKNWLNIMNDQEEDFYIQSIKSIPVNSQCRREKQDDKVAIHLQHQIGTQIQGGIERTNASGTITMDSSDLKGGIKLKVQTSPCRLDSPDRNQGRNQGRNCRIVRINGRAQNVCD
jgi:hypothetical protein